MIVEPMTDAELDGLRSKIFAYNRKERSRLRLFGQNVIRILARLDAERTRADAAEAERDQHATAYIELHGQHVAKMIELADARSALKRAEAERDAAVARAMPEWQPIETAPHDVLVLLYCPDRGPANTERIELGYASHGSRNAVSSSISRHAWATMWQPLPDLPIPTPGDAP